MHRLPAVPLAWGVALRVWWEHTVWNAPVTAVTHRLANGRSGWLSLSPEDVVAVVHRSVPGTRGPNRCLFRTLVRFGLLQRTGTDPAAVCLGVQSPDTADQFAHAWVEVNGIPVGEPTDPRTTHQVLARWDGSETNVRSSTSAATTK